MTNMVGFPELGIEPFSLNRVAFEFSLFGKEISIAWYGIILTCAILVACLYAWRKLTKAGLLNTDQFLDLALWAIPLSVVGARLYFVIAQFGDYFLNENRAWWEFLAIWQGGLAIYGAIIAGFFTVLIFCLVKKINPWSVFDCAAPSLMLGQAIGRWANFVNAEAYGIETSLPWRMSVNGSMVHPTFLYESLWNIIGFVALQFVMKKKKFSGQILSLYVSWYGLGRFWIEWLRSDSLPYGADFRISQIVAALCFFGGIVAYFLLRRLDEKAAFEAAMQEAVNDELEETHYTADSDEGAVVYEDTTENDTKENNTEDKGEE